MHLVLAALMLLGQPVSPPTVAQLQTWYEAGRYQQVVDRAAELSDPQATYLAALSYEGLGRLDEARGLLAVLAARGDADPWSWIARSEQALVNRGKTASALDDAQRAAQRALDVIAGAAQGNVTAPAGAQSGQNRPAQPPTGRQRPAAATAAQNRPAANRPTAQFATVPIVSPGPARAIATYQLGHVMASREQYAEAAEAFRRVIELAPSFEYAYYYAGLAHSRLGRADQMAINFERFLQLAPEAPEASRVQSLMRSVRGR